MLKRRTVLAGLGLFPSLAMAESAGSKADYSVFHDGAVEHVSGTVDRVMISPDSHGTAVSFSTGVLELPKSKDVQVSLHNAGQVFSYVGAPEYKDLGADSSSRSVVFVGRDEATETPVVFAAPKGWEIVSAELAQKGMIPSRIHDPSYPIKTVSTAIRIKMQLAKACGCTYP